MSSSSDSSSRLCCSHLLAYRSSSRPFRSLLPCLRPRSSPLGRAEISRDPHEVPRCSLCPNTPTTGNLPASFSPRLFACLTCAAVLCPSHAPSHSHHDIAVDVDRAELFCLRCSDQIYDPDFDSTVLLSLSSTNVNTNANANVAAAAFCKRRRVNYLPWTPDPVETSTICKGSRALVIDESTLASASASNSHTSSSSGVEESSPVGVRGMNNLGNTCFMGSVLQALMHTPPMRNYFLSDKHNRSVCCQMKGRRKKSGGGSGNVCLACDFDDMYSGVFSGDRTPYSPAKFLYSWWQHASNLASYEQQDAHEFFISILDGIHEKLERDQHGPHAQSSGDCCIAHRVFSGILRSDVMCTVCGFTSTTYDPCVDISLDLDSSQSPPKLPRSKSHARNGETESKLSNQSSEISTLMGCLERFTRPERLGCDQKLFCQQCQVRQDSLKQMSIRKLPLVTCFHIKRFEHSAIRKMSRKLDRYLQFPFSLNMAPYLSSSILKSRYGNRILNIDADASDVASDLASEFELFAMITHSGKLEAGHYITYLRLNNQWYKCDDAWIIHVTENTVRASQAYMLFYVQKTLYYKASENAMVVIKNASSES